ncbi:MAG: PVC-type heme-binding CxxCH protein [Verrucomicrobiota bacterium]
MRVTWFFLFLAIAWDRGVFADEFPEVFNSEANTELVLTDPETALQMMELPSGFQSTVFASEPEVRNPIAMAWDAEGRVWVAENYTYAEKATRFEMGLRDRVIILEDTDWDGKADRRTVFSDKLQMLTSVEVGQGGVWVMCPPQLLFIPDRDGNDQPDSEPEVILDGFTVGLNSYHNFANGLRWGPDGWLYGRCGHSCPGKLGVPGTPAKQRVPIEGGIWRFHPESKSIEVLTHGTTNPWGHDWDRHGELFFINTVNGHLWHSIPGAHFTESFGGDPNPFVYERIDTHADHYHYDRTGKWSESRDGAADQFGGGHAHVGMMIYQGDTWPERFHDRLFTLNLHGRRTNVERLDREGSGFVGRHEPDIFITKDPWFRGIDIQQGPDGSVFILDWSDIGECHEHTGVHRSSGRIYRVSYGEVKKPDLRGGESFEAYAIDALIDPNPWHHRQVLSQIRGGVEDHALKRLCWPVLRGTGEVYVRLRALWTLAAFGEALHLESLLDDEEEAMRAWALRLLLDERPLDTIMGPSSARSPQPMAQPIFSKIMEMAETDHSGLVRLTLASSLQRLPLMQRRKLGLVLAQRTEDANDHNMPEMVWFGISPLMNSDPQAVVEFARKTSWPDLQRWIARAVANGMEKDPGLMDTMISLISKQDESAQESMLQGVSEGLKGWASAPEPAGWESLRSRLSDSGNETLIGFERDLSLLFGDGRALEELVEIAENAEEDPLVRIKAVDSLVASRIENLREICLPLLNDRIVNLAAARGLALFDEPKLGEEMARRYLRFTPGNRPGLLEVLVSRKAWAGILLKEIENGKIPRKELSAFQARVIRNYGDPILNEKLSLVWGVIKDSDDAKRQLVEEWTEKLSPEVLEQANLSGGRQLYAAVCGACHVMYGEGGQIGPDLTGSNRYDLGYLLENIFDPGSEVASDYRMTSLTLEDGRSLTGVIAEENEKTLTLRQANLETMVEQSMIVSREMSEVSMMPEGLLLALSEAQVRDLIAYLMHPSQVAGR